MNLDELANQKKETSELNHQLVIEINKTLMREYSRQKYLSFLPFLVAADAALTEQRTIMRAYLEQETDISPDLLARLKEGQAQLEKDMERIINEPD